MTGLLECCLGCGAPVEEEFHLCGRCRKSVGVGRNGEPVALSQKVFFERRLEMSDEKLVRFVKRGLFVKSFVLAGMIAAVILAHPGLVLLQSAAHRICSLTSSCPLA